MVIDEIWNGIAANIQHLKPSTQFNMKLAFYAGVAASGAQFNFVPLLAIACKTFPEFKDGVFDRPETETLSGSPRTPSSPPS